MSREREREEIDSLVETLKRLQKEYYVSGRISVPDREYDGLFDRLQSLEHEFPDLIRDDSPTQRVGSDLSQEFPEVEHSVPVLSLDKCYSVDEIFKWTAKVQDTAGQPLSFVLEEKIDGASIVLYYEQGRLIRAVTRGNGLVGNDITGNVRTIRDVPLMLTRPLTLSCRGEIFLPKRLFEELNSKMEIPYANPRNLAAGTLRRIRSSEVARIPLDIFIYEGYMAERRATHLEILGDLNDLGFKLNPNMGFFTDREEFRHLAGVRPSWRFGSLSDMKSFVEEELKERDTLDYEIDGLVLKVNEIPVRDDLGYTGHHPRWAVAYKFESPVGKTVVRNIEVQIGRTGRATPVARVSPVRISGSFIRNVTLHNQEYIDLLELAIGDAVEVSKRGDVIPAVGRVLEKNEEGNTTWHMPDTCPTCESPLRRVGAHHFCTNPSCLDQVRGRLFFFAGRGQMDIENLGPETIDFLIRKGLVRDIPDIYFFDPESLQGEPGFGDKKINLIREGIRSSKKKSFRSVLISLGIPELGQKAADLLLDVGFRDMDSLLELSDRQDFKALTAIHGFGGKTAESILNELSRPDVRRRIEFLRKAGLNFAVQEATGLSGTARYPFTFKGQTWCVTGSFEHYNPRELAMEEVKLRGGHVSSTVGSGTTHLLVGRNPGSKLQKAISTGIKVVDETEFRGLLGDV